MRLNGRMSQLRSQEVKLKLSALCCSLDDTKINGQLREKFRLLLQMALSDELRLTSDWRNLPLVVVR